MKNAKIGRMNGRACEYYVEDNWTVADLLGAAEEELAKGEEIVCDGEPVDTDYDFEDGDEFVIMPSTTGA